MLINMKHIKTLNSSGDTIVEVLVVLAVLSLSFVTSYTIAVKSLGQSRNAQEHSETLGNINSQTEWLRTAITNKVALPVGTPFCMTSPTTFDAGFLPGNTVSGNAAGDDFSKYPAACKSGLYYSSIIYSGDAAGDFDIKLRWDGNGSLGRQQEEINYRTHELTADLTDDIPTVATPAQITFHADKIDPIGGPYGLTTPPCTDPAGLGKKGGTSVTLKLTDGSGSPQTKSTDSVSGLATFQNLTDSAFYTLTINGVASEYELCPTNSFPDTSDLSQLAPGEQRSISRKIRPICHIDSGIGPPYAHYLGNYADYQGYYSDYLGNYADYLGNYGDPYTVYWDQPALSDYAGHTAGRYVTLPTPVDSSFFWVWRSDIPHHSTGWYYEIWQHKSGTAYTAPYDHYSGAYDHYSGAYDHYTAPYDHYTAPYGDPYTNSICPS